MSKALQLLALAAVAAALSACGGKSTEEQIGEALGRLSAGEFKKDQLVVENLSESAGFATAEITLRTAVKMRKEKGEWVIEEVRLGDRRWEKAERLIAALNAVRREAAVDQLRQISEGIVRYRLATSQPLPEGGFEELIDTLTPTHLAQAIRLDPWFNPFRFQSLGSEGYDLRSAGPDGAFDTSDDVIAEKR